MGATQRRVPLAAAAVPAPAAAAAATSIKQRAAHVAMLDLGFSVCLAMEDTAAMSPPLSLRAAFVRGGLAHAALERSPLPSSSPAYQAQVEEALSALRQAAAQASAAGVFSANETLDDVATADLKYLLIDALLGDLAGRRASTSTEPAARVVVVRDAEAHLRAFLHRLASYSLLSSDDRAALDDAERGVQWDATRQREYKVAKFKRQRAAQARVAELTARLADRRPGSITNSADAARPAWLRGDDGSGSGGGGDGDGSVDEELGREHILVTVQAQALAAIDALHMYQQELAILAHMERVRDEAGPSGALAAAPPAPPAATAPPFKPIVIRDTRAAAAASIFRPGWRQPTMTLDEFLALERARGNIMQGGGPAQAAAMAQAQATEDARDSDADADAATYKAREWDKFTDDNPRGWGNRHNRS
jgi:immunoglobulin-binding protein 1